MSDTVNYSGYRARRLGSQRGVGYRVLRRAYRFVRNDVLYDTLLYPYGVMRHKAMARSAQRSQSHTYTSFCRSPAQIQVMLKLIAQRLGGHAAPRRRLDILLFACSNGAEAYTVASRIRNAMPELDFQIHASDLHTEMIEKATAARYTRDEVLHSDYITDEFIRTTFDVDGDGYSVQPAIQALVTFARADLLDARLRDRYARADLVFAQNVLFHLDPASARSAFDNVAQCLKPEGVLFLEGMDLNLKVELTRKRNLRPVADQCRAIHEQSRVHIPMAWWNHYYGTEPYSMFRKDHIRRYSTIFLAPAA